MAGSNATTHMQRQFSQTDALTYDRNLAHTKWWYKKWNTETLKYDERKEYLPDANQTITYGSGTPLVFTIPLHPDLTGPVQLIWNQTPVTLGGGTYARFKDHAALAMIERIEVRQANNRIFVHYPIKKYLRCKKFLTDERKAFEDINLAGDLTATQRDFLATQTQEFTYCIPFPWSTGRPGDYQEIKPLSQPLTYNIYFNKLSHFIETDSPGGAGVSTTTTNMRSRHHNVYFLPTERDAHWAATQEKDGFVRLIEESFFESNTNQVIPAGQTGVFNYDIKNVKSSLRWIAFFLIPTQYAFTDWNNRIYDDTVYYKGLKRFRLASGIGDEITPWIDYNYSIFYLSKAYWNGRPGIPIVVHTWDDNPQNEFDAKGRYNLQGIQNPQLQLDFGTVATVDNLQPVVIYSQDNFTQTVKGELNTTFV